MKIFVDSNLLIEYEKQTQTELLEALLASGHQIFLNPIVVSEYLYQLLGILGGRSPMSICESKKIAETLEPHDTAEFLSVFAVLPIPNEVLPVSIDMMKKHNLLPNDALILACCVLQNVAVLASFDSDFTAACEEEGILLLRKVVDIPKL